MIEFVFFQDAGAGARSIENLFIESIEQAKAAGVDSQDTSKWVDSLGNQTRFESVQVYNWLRDIKEK